MCFAGKIIFSSGRRFNHIGLTFSGNSMFVATDNGLTILKKNKDVWKVERILTTTDGLLSNSVNDVIECEQKLYVATSGGLSILDEPVFVKRKFIGQTLVTEMVT